MATKPIANLSRMAKDIQMWLVDKLIPWVRNPRTHSDAQVAQIAASIVEFGFNNPILVDNECRHYRGARAPPRRAQARTHGSPSDRAGSFDRGLEACVCDRRQQAGRKRWLGR
jgi:hypothetical protein